MSDTFRMAHYHFYLWGRMSHKLYAEAVCLMLTYITCKTALCYLCQEAMKCPIPLSSWAHRYSKNILNLLFDSFAALQ